MQSTLISDPLPINDLNNSPNMHKASFDHHDDNNPLEKVHIQKNAAATVSKTKRTQVKNACVNCQKACKKCDDGRPCQRCIKYNLVDTCKNSIRKTRKKGIKRGPYKQKSIETKKTKSTSSTSEHVFTVSKEETVNKIPEQSTFVPSDKQQQTMMAQFPCWQDDIFNISHPSVIPFPPQQYDCYTVSKSEPNLTSSISSSMLIPDGNQLVYPFFSSKNQDVPVSQNFFPQPLLSYYVENNQKQQTSNNSNCTIDFDFCKRSQGIIKPNVYVSAINNCHNQEDYFSLH